jgi:hypothetical protein
LLTLNLVAFFGKSNLPNSFQHEEIHISYRSSPEPFSKPNDQIKSGMEPNLIERLHLTSEFINAAIPPERGERWIGDAEISGFGLRLWATRSGEGKAFAIRTAALDGKSVRRTFDPRDSFEYRYAPLLGCEPGELGSYLASARRWAGYEITRLKGRVSRLEKRENIRIGTAEQTLLSTVQEAAENLFDGMRRRNLSEPYIDRLDKLFSVHLPDTIRSALLAKVTASDIAIALSAADLSPTALRLVRVFIGRIFEEAAPAQPSLLHFTRELGDRLHQLRGERYDLRFPELKDLTEEDYEKIFQRLEAEHIYWQQAMCVRLFFEFWTPFYRLMGARWDGIIDRRWYPYPLSERRLNLRYGGRADGQVAALLDRAHRLGTEKFGPNPYWFPSKFGRKFDHIRTVDTIWRNTLHDIRLRYFPLREVALNYRRSLFLLRSRWNRIHSQQVSPDRGRSGPTLLDPSALGGGIGAPSEAREPQ